MTLDLTWRGGRVSCTTRDPADRPVTPGAAVPPDPQSVRIAASEHRDRASVAAHVGVSPRQLRRFTNEDPEIRNALHLGDADRLARDFHLCLSIGSWGAF